MSENETENSINNQSAMLAELESLEIPPDLDPRLLALWLDREREDNNKNGKPKKSRKPRYGNGLPAVFAGYVGIVAMCLAIVLGWVQGLDSNEILVKTCWTFLIYCIIGLFAGWVAEYCVRDSVETLLREIVRRGEEADSRTRDESATESVR